MRQHIQKPRIGIRHWRALVLTEFHIVKIRRQIRSSDEIEPFLHLILVSKPRFVVLSARREEHIQIKFIELPLHGNLPNAIGNAVCEHHHARKREIRIIRASPVLLCPLLVGVRPVVYLVLDELARIYRPERRTRKEKIMLRGDWEERLVVDVARFFLLVLFDIEICLFLIGIVEKLFRILAPRPIMVFIKYDQIPVFGMDEFILRLDATRFIRAKKILKRPKHHNRPLFHCLLVLVVDVYACAVRILVRNKLPSIEIDVAYEIVAPCRFNCRLECKHQNAPKSHFLCKLIGGECLAEAHLRIP